VIILKKDKFYIFTDYEIYIKPIPLSARSKAWVCGRSVVGMASSNPKGGMDFLHSCDRAS
jgi:hypothetical protein